MKKLFVLIALFTAVYTANAQGGAKGQGTPSTQKEGNDAAMAQRVKETKDFLVEKAKITQEQAEKIMEINMEVRKSLGDIRNLSEDERKTKIAGLAAERTKRYKEIPLTDEQVKAVNDAFNEMKKQAEARSSGS